MKLADVVRSLITVINMAVGVLVPLALVIFFYGLVKYIYNSSDATAHKEGRETIFWSLLALFVLISIWGILALLNTAFFNAPIQIVPGYYQNSTGPTTGTPGGTGGIY